MGKFHGKKNSRVYKIWDCMKYRCDNVKGERYHRYGGRGIKICEEWYDFKIFYRDMGDPPSSLHSIDRINNDLGYSKNNCRWATRSEQLKNTSRSRLVNIAGIEMNIIDWLGVLKIPRTGYSKRIHTRMVEEISNRLAS